MIHINVEKFYELQGELTDTAFAKKIGISRSQLWRARTGHSSVGSEFLVKFKKAFPQVNIEEYFFYS